ncbi:unnamed protein product [Bursaphelenchus xylophilus]|uniref:(pine wood nematode) hypothetical protein n=1 Tax=Bursaphelenchus xylophilus TaxID=6326 RepID=A0A7I8WFL5_BURXY|nr:unnamed protein product [Bursaphelenchus xylophilus]CAG9112026.1 unnamed protein product [Bursaphelenchus xylophilus]
MAQFGFKESELFAAFAKFANPASGDENQETFSRSLSPELRPEDLKMEMDENENCNNEMKFDDNLTAELFKSVGQVDGSSTPGKSNGYRAELKRPDLKGQFRCTICNKVFCHSSSLSRHRMQAHFKSYTCTLCSKEITSNETLRAHMLKQHQISRMFMCRCCNWAFPDKTSLHMHMQGKSEGASKSLNVPVIGKGIPPISSPPTQPLNFSNDELFNNVLAAQLNNPQLRNAFPALNPMNLAGMGLNPTVSTSFASSVIKPGITSPLTPSSTASGASCENPQSSLFPQLSMMPRDNADLFSKLRDRLFLNNLWLPGGNLMNMAQFAAHNTTEGTEGNSEENVFNIFSNPNVFATQPDQMAAKALSTSQQQALQTLMQQFMQKSEKPDVNDSNNNDTNNNVDNEKDVEVKVESEPEEPAAPSLEIQEDHSSHQPFSAGASPTNSNSSASPSNNSSCFDCQVAKTKLMELSLEIQKIRQQKTQADQELSEKNEALARRLTEIRARLAKFMEEPEAANNSDFVREIMRFTMLQ